MTTYTAKTQICRTLRHRTWVGRNRNQTSTKRLILIWTIWISVRRAGLWSCSYGTRYTARLRACSTRSMSPECPSANWGRERPAVCTSYPCSTVLCCFTSQEVHQIVSALGYASGLLSHGTMSPLGTKRCRAGQGMWVICIEMQILFITEPACQVYIVFLDIYHIVTSCVLRLTMR